MRAIEIYEAESIGLTKAQMEYILHTLSNRPNEQLNFEVIVLSGLYTIIENSSKVIVIQTRDEDEADQLCDEFNHDKDTGKDALVQSLITNRKKYQI